MRKLLLFFAFIQFASFLFAQPYGNEWIDYASGKPYYKIKVAKDGIYRIPFSTLSHAISNLSSINPLNFLLYHNGQAVPIYISTSGSIGSNDYIEFYGEHNIGFADSMLYVNSIQQPNPYYSLFNDTSIYFLTTNTSLNNPRITDIINAPTSLAPESYFNYASRVELHDQFFDGQVYFLDNIPLYESLYEGEGFTGLFFNSTQAPLNTTVNINTPFVFLGTGSSATFKTSYISRSAEQHHIQTRINNTIVLDDTSVGYKYFKPVTSINLSLLNSSNSIVYTELINSISQDENIVGFAELTYPRQYNFGGQSTFLFTVAGDAGNQKYLNITGVNDHGTQPLLYDLTNGYRIRSNQPSGSNPAFLLPASTNDRTLYLRSDVSSDYLNVDTMLSIHFTNFNDPLIRASDYVIVYHPILNSDPVSHSSPVTDYRNYRDRSFGGKFYTAMVNVEELYDQFAYGVRKSPLAIRNFINYAQNVWTPGPQYFFLIGKAREYPIMRSDLAATNECLIPTFGSPGSDVLFSCTRTVNRPKAAVGRLAAQNAQQVKDYLSKIKDYEANQAFQSCNINDKEWTKEVLHFGGGTSSGETTTFQSYLCSYKAIIQDTFFGGHVTSYFKSSSTPIQTVQSDALRARIIQGVSLMTFFGHSSTSGFDINFDLPENYPNVGSGKYPIVIANGCLSGQLNDDNAHPSFSERFVFAPNKAGIAFIASTGIGVSSGLNEYTRRLYESISFKNYHQGIGKAIQRVVHDLDSIYPTDFNTTLTSEEMSLHGDPAIIPNGAAFGNNTPAPDYAIDASSVFFTPSIIPANADSFQLNVIVTNLGKAVNDSFVIAIHRTVYDANNNPVTFDYRKKVKATLFMDTFVITMPTVVATSLGHGQNLFDVHVDADQHVAEGCESNNDLINQLSTFIQGDDIIPIYPYEFAIVPQQGVILKASTIDPFAPLRSYRFEIDTTERFNSTLKVSGNITQKGGVVHWTPSITLRDSTVYYWRVGWDTNGVGGVKNYHYSSFIYLKNEFPGWNQSHYFQYRKDTAYQLNLNVDPDRVFRFPGTANEVRVYNNNFHDPNYDPYNLQWFYNNISMHTGRFYGCGGYWGGLTFAVIDGVTGTPWLSTNNGPGNYGPYGNIHCPPPSHYYQQSGFDFLIDSLDALHPDQTTFPGKHWSDVIVDFLNAIPAGSYVLGYTNTIIDPHFTAWNQNIINKIVSLGATDAASLKNGTIKGPYAFFLKKGDTLSYRPQQVHKDSLGLVLDTRFVFSGHWSQGTYETPLIGPAASWGSVHWRHKALETPTYDSDSLEIIGTTSAGIDTTLIKTTILDNFINTISAKKYPYLRLKLDTKDDSLRTPTQLKYWRVLYKKVPEAALNPAAYFYLKDSVKLGDTLKIGIALENVTDLPMDSMRTKYTINDATNKVLIDSTKQDSLRALQTMILNYNKVITSNSFNGVNRLVIEANPAPSQLEQFHFNNIATLKFHAQGDKINPLLDVTFDGQHIMDGDIVSAKPTILITLKDENKYLALNDTSLIQVYLKYPGEASPRRIIFDGINAIFYPAVITSGKSNIARIELKPYLNIDSTYALYIADQDRSGNNSSRTNYRLEYNIYYDYKTTFRVYNKPMVTNVLNYPNPFTTSTRFVFTLTGTDVPDFMKIQIMTIRGKVVKEIFKPELGNLHIGVNITDYAWDGRDQYGAALGNGVYFYRVITSLNGDGKSMDHLNESYDKYFKHGFGKMVLIR